MKKSHWLSMAALLAACGPAPEVMLSGAPAVTVFQGNSVSFPLTLQWEGEPRALEVAANSSTGLTVEAVSVAPGTSQVNVTLSASEGATGGELSIRASGEGVESQLTVAVTVASASVLSSSDEPLLRGGRSTVLIAFAGGTPGFEGVSSAQPLADGQWRLMLPVSADASIGDNVLTFAVTAGGATQTLTAPVSVTDTVTVTMRDVYEMPLPGREVFVNGAGPALTNSAGQAAFPGVTAPYRLSFSNATGILATTFDGATLAAPIIRGDGTNLPARSVDGEFRLERADNRALITGHQSAWVNVQMQGQPGGDGIGFVAGGSQTTDSIQWRSELSTQHARLRAVAWVDGKIRWYGDTSTTLDDAATEPEMFTLLMSPPELGSLRSEVQLPAGFSVQSRSLFGIFSDNRFDTIQVGGSESANLNVELDMALARDDLRHVLTVYAQDLAGRRVSRSWTGLAVGDAAVGELPEPPAMDGVSTTAITDATEFRWTGGWPLYQLTVAAGEDAARRTEIILTTAQSRTRPAILTLPSGTAGRYQICGSDRATSVDDLLRDTALSFGNTFQAGSTGCGLSQPVTYTSGP